jgi:hypothetical protein
MNSKKILTTIVTVVAVVIIGWLIWKGIGVKTTPVLPTTTTLQATSLLPAEQTVTSVTKEKTPVEKYFDGIKAVEPTTEKGKTVHAILLPILQKLYNEEANDKIVEGVKLQEQFGSMLTYVFNRVVTNDDMTAVKTELEAQGFKTAEASGKGMTMMKVGQSWVLTFWLNNQQKAGLEVTF